MSPSNDATPKTLILTGAAGLVGQNLTRHLRRRKDLRIIAIDKHKENNVLLSRMNPGVHVITADLAEPGPWQDHFTDAAAVVQLHMQAKGSSREVFERNNVMATRRVLEQMTLKGVPHLVHLSSAAVHSKATDHYSTTKAEQEALVRAGTIPHCILRPTLLYGPMDPKHLGWLSRFMRKTPVFPIPGMGRFVRQPIYVRDLCKVIEVCIDRRIHDEIYDLVGVESILYIDLIREIRRAVNARTLIAPLPVSLFGAMLDMYGWVSSKPAFTRDQLEALAVGDIFQGVDMEETFGVKATPFCVGVRESFGKGNDPIR